MTTIVPIKKLVKQKTIHMNAYVYIIKSAQLHLSATLQKDLQTL